MSRTVFCRKYQEALEGLDFPPMPGKKGEDLFANVSKKAWEEWQAQQTMLINEKHLSLMDPTPANTCRHRWNIFSTTSLTTRPKATFHQSNSGGLLF